MYAKRAVAAAVVGLLAAGAACFSSNAPPAPMPSDDGSADDVASRPDDAASEAEAAVVDGHVDAPADGSVPADAPAEAVVPSDAPGSDSSSDATLEASLEASIPADAGGGFVRVANMASAVASLDFCVKAMSAAAFGGPYMHGQQGLTVPYQSVSEYDALPAASGYVVRIVAGGATDCSTGLATDVTVGPSVATSATTVVVAAAAADAGAALLVTALTDDDPTTSPAGQTRFRAVHAAPSVGPVAYQIGVAPYTEALQTAVPYGAAFAASTATSGAPAPDAQGYIAPGYGQAQVTVVVAGTERTSFYVGNGSVPTASSTAFLVGSLASSSDPLGFVNCNELGVPSPTTHLSPCTFSSAAPGTETIRILHASPDQGAIEVCAGLGPSSQAFSSNLLQAGGVSGGLAFGELSGDLTTMPAGTDIKVGFVLAGQTCATAGQFLTVGTGLFPTEWTFAMYESTLPPSVSYNIYLFVTNQSPDSYAQVNLANMTPLASGPNVDLFLTGSSSAEMQIGQTAGPYHYTGFTNVPADTYSIRVADDTTQADLYTTTGVQLAEDEEYLLAWIQGSAAQGILAQCPLSQRSADTVTTCPQ